MIKFDTQKGHVLLAGSGVEIMADMTMLVTKAFYKMSHESEHGTKTLLKMYSNYLSDLADDPDFFEKLAKDDDGAATIDLSHLMNKRE